MKRLVRLATKYKITVFVFLMFLISLFSEKYAIGFVFFPLIVIACEVDRCRHYIRMRETLDREATRSTGPAL